MIRTRSVTKYYGARCALRDLTFEIQDSEVVGFLGLNGAGKSTTLRILAGLLAPSSGHVEIDGEPLEIESPSVRQRIGFLPERPPVYDDMSIRGYLAFAAQLQGMPRAQVMSAVDEVLHQTDLVDRADDPIGALSHGYRQRVGIAQAIVHRPSLVILDEPTSGLDPVQITQMRSLIRTLRGRHTVLLSSHNLPEIHQTCDRLLVMKSGKLVATGTESELVARSEGRQAIRLTLVGDDAAIRRVLPEVKDLRAEGDAWRCAALVEGTVEDAIKDLVEAGVGIRRVEPDRDGLEDLFLQLTGGPAS